MRGSLRPLSPARRSRTISGCRAATAAASARLRLQPQPRRRRLPRLRCSRAAARRALRRFRAAGARRRDAAARPIGRCNRQSRSRRAPLPTHQRACRRRLHVRSLAIAGVGAFGHSHSVAGVSVRARECATRWARAWAGRARCSAQLSARLHACVLQEQRAAAADADMRHASSAKPARAAPSAKADRWMPPAAKVDRGASLEKPKVSDQQLSALLQGEYR